MVQCNRPGCGGCVWGCFKDSIGPCMFLCAPCALALFAMFEECPHQCAKLGAAAYWPCLRACYNTAMAGAFVMCPGCAACLGRTLQICYQECCG